MAIPITMGGMIPFQVENVMASVAAAWALGLDWDTIRNGLSSFSNDTHNALGRFNLFQYRGATVIADYGHNPDAMLALVQAVQAMPAKRRSVVISGAGDRRDQDIRQQTEILGDAFDEVILYEDQCQRGRRDGEVIALLRQGLANARAPPRPVRNQGRISGHRHGHGQIGTRRPVPDSGGPGGRSPGPHRRHACKKAEASSSGSPAVGRRATAFGSRATAHQGRNGLGGFRRPSSKSTTAWAMGISTPRLNVRAAPRCGRCTRLRQRGPTCQ
jgi:hypothetical protein